MRAAKQIKSRLEMARTKMIILHEKRVIEYNHKAIRLSNTVRKLYSWYPTYLPTIGNILKRKIDNNEINTCFLYVCSKKRVLCQK